MKSAQSARPAGGGPARPPVIGITARTVPVTIQGAQMVVSLSLQSHVDFLAAAGCIPVVIPLRPGNEEILGSLQGLLVPGGPDIDPELYGQHRHPTTHGGSPGMDRAELALIGAALAGGLPLLAICRGMQLLNVQCGGTLHQHLPEVTGSDGHRPQGDTFEFGRHALDVHEGSHIARIFGDDTPKTACHHHQAVDQVGTGLTVTARAPDGVVEVVEAAGHPFAVGVQWEAGQTEDDRLHRALADAARRL